MDYAEFTPTAALAPFVHCVWTFSARDSGMSSDRIVPDGRPELIVHLGEPFDEMDAGGAWRPQPRALFAGQVTRSLLLRAPSGASVIGVRFRPAGARPFLGQSMRFTTDARMPLAAALPGVGRAFARRIAAAGTLSEQVLVAQDFVAAMIAANEHERDAVVEACVARIEAAAGTVDVDEMAADAGLSRRQLERRFADVVGVGPALLAAIFRFRSVFDLLQRDAARLWTDAALAAGYYDQSHFIREFRRFVGCTPSEFQRTRAGLAAALVER